MTKINFVDNQAPALSAANLNQLQTNIENVIMPIGAGCDYYGSNLPTNFLWADGSAISRTTYSELFAIIGTTYGDGDGSTTFNLPDKRERVSVMYKENSTNGTTGATLGILGAKGGEFKHTLSDSELNTHFHDYNDNTLGSYINNPIGYLSSTGTIPVGRAYENSDFTSSYSGANTPFNVLQPYLVCNYIIRAK